VPVERIPAREEAPTLPPALVSAEGAAPTTLPSDSPPSETRLCGGILASPHELPNTPYPVVQTLFVLFQLMYLAFYVGALANLAEIQDLLSQLTKSTHIFTILVVTAGDSDSRSCIHPLGHAFSCSRRERKAFEDLAGSAAVRRALGSVTLPAAAPHQLRAGAGMHNVAGLLTFAQRSLVLMGAGNPGVRA